MSASHGISFFKSAICLSGIALSGSIACVFVDHVFATEPVPTPVVQDSPRQTVPDLPKSPPADLLFDSIRRELSVDHNRSEPTSDKRPWGAIESLLKAARKLETQAAQMEASGDTKGATLFRSKSSIIRSIAIELLGVTPNTNSQ